MNNKINNFKIINRFNKMIKIKLMNKCLQNKIIKNQ